MTRAPYGFARRHHGEHRAWESMIARCHVATNMDWPSYGGRGISVCARWREGFVAFIDDMGPRPSPAHSLDRINNDGNYEPGNCRWATAKEQAGNRRPRAGYKLTSDDAAAIRSRLSAGASLNSLAKAYGVHQSLISAIKANRIWIR